VIFVAQRRRFVSAIRTQGSIFVTSAEIISSPLRSFWSRTGSSNAWTKCSKRMFEKSSAGNRSSSRDANYQQYRQALGYRFDRCSLGTDRADVTGSPMRRPTTQNQHSRCIKRNLLSATNRLPMAFASPRVSSVEHGLSRNVAASRLRRAKARQRPQASHSGGHLRAVIDGLMHNEVVKSDMHSTDA
jgi:hypothetical protein